MLILTLIMLFFGVILQMICNKKENKLFGIIPPIYFFIFSIVITMIFVQINGSNAKILDDEAILEIMEEQGYSLLDIENYLEEGEDISSFFEGYRNEMKEYILYITKVLFILLNFPTLISAIISIIVFFHKRKRVLLK